MWQLNAHNWECRESSLWAPAALHSQHQSLLTHPNCCCSPLISTPGLLQSLSWGTGFLTLQRDAGCVTVNWVHWRLGKLVLGQSPKHSTWTRESGKVAPASQVLVCGSGTDPESEKQPWRSGVKLQPLWNKCLLVAQRCLQQDVALCQLVRPIACYTGPQLRLG